MIAHGESLFLNVYLFCNMEENMKKILKLAAIVAGVATVLFASCSNLNSDATVSDDTSVSSSKEITLTARADEKVLEFPSSGDSSARTILPDSINADNLDFFLAYKTLKETNWTVRQTTFTASADDKTVGTVTETFELNSYEFKLYAVPQGVVTASATLAESTVKTAAALAGYATADLRYNTAVAFTLTANNMTGQGKLEIGIKTVAGFTIPAGYTVTAGLYDYDTSSQIVYPTSSAAPITVASDGTVNDTTSFKVDTSTIDAGSYNLVVTLTNTNVTPNKSYKCSEKVIVLTNQTTKGTFWIRDIIDYPPTQPADFIAGFTDPTSSDSSHYIVEFAWTDTSDCETGFELELMKVDDKTSTALYPKMPTTDDEWGDEAKTKGLAKDFNAAITTTSPTLWEDITDSDVLLLNKTNLSKCPLFVSYSGSGDSVGSLNMNQSHLKMLLPMEHRFVARIRAVNDVGNSDYTYLDLHKIPASPTTFASTDGCAKGTDITVGGKTVTPTQTNDPYTLTMQSFDDDVATMNRYQIKYDLNGGTYVDADGTLAASKMPATILYESQHNADASTASVSTSKVAIIHPNSIKADTSATPPITGVTGAENDYIDTTGTAQSGVHVELKDANGSYWLTWMKGDVNGTAYATDLTAGSEDYTPPLYTGFKNLYLVAKFKTTVDVTADVNFTDMSRYELNKGFFTVALKSGVTDKTADYITESSTLWNEATNAGDGTTDSLITLADATDPLSISDTIDGITISLNTNAKYTDDAGAAHDIKYSKIHLRITRIADNAVTYDADAASGTFDFKLTNYLLGKYLFTISATKGTYTYDITQIVRISQ